MRSNLLRKKLDMGEPTIGTRVSSIWGGVAELVGQSNHIDYVEFVSEYAPFDNLTLENFARAVDLYDHMTSMIKLDAMPRQYLATRAAGAGIQNFLFADIRGVEDAREAVSAVRADSPSSRGHRGFTANRESGYGYGVSPRDYVEALDKAVVMLMIEKKTCVDDLDSVLAVPGIDMVQFGPADYSMSAGHLDDMQSAETKAAELKTIETALSLGIQPRAEINSAEQAKNYLAMGVRHFSIGTEMRILRNFWEDEGGKLRNIVSSG